VFRRLSDEEGKGMMIKAGKLPAVEIEPKHDAPKDAPPNKL
jgi:hypothetical protein